MLAQKLSDYITNDGAAGWKAANHLILRHEKELLVVDLSKVADLARKAGTPESRLAAAMEILTDYQQHPEEYR